MERSEHENQLADPDLIVPDKDALRFGAFDDGRLLGAGSLTERDADYELSALVVAPEFRGRGHGAALVAHMIRWARERVVFLLCSPSQRDFFGRFGFTEVPIDTLPDEMPRKLREHDVNYGKDGEPILAMSRRPAP